MTKPKNQIQNDENSGAAAADGALSDSDLEQVAGGMKVRTPVLTANNASPMDPLINTAGRN